MLRREERMRLLEIAAEAGAPEFLLVESAQRMEAYVLDKPLPPTTVEVAANKQPPTGQTSH